ncbi:MAG: hypothetical protein KC619_23110 [Myxococcales bacterium]|nr:hypothetical protein [Myxococcales bacterium]
MARRLALLALLAIGCAEPGRHDTAALEAPGWALSTAGTGTWEVDGEPGLVHAWVDARVANLRYDKRVFVEVLAPYEGGRFMRTLHHAVHRAPEADGRERWGTDAIEIYPEGGPWGAHLAGPVAYRLSMQHSVDGEERMVVTPWRALYGEGALVLPENDPFDTAPSAELHPGASPAAPEVLFSPWDDPGRRVLAEIDALIEAQQREPDVRHTLHAAVFNVYDDEIVDRLIAAHRAGVEVRLMIDGRKLRPWYDWHRGDDRLLDAGVPVLGVLRPETGAMHDKIAIFDGRRVMTGSMNWEPGARHENHENVVVLEDPEAVAAYAARLHAVAGGVQRARAHAVDPHASISVSFAPDEHPAAILGQLVDAAEHTVHVAMFTCKDVEYWQDGRRTSIFERLASAAARGVDVVVIVDEGIAEASEYHGVLSEDDPSDERLEAMGVRVVRADNLMGPYASMHHKVTVIDGAVAVTGAFNWYYDAAFRNDEDQLVIRDPAVAARFEGEIVDLLRRYDEGFDASAWPAASIEIEATNDRTVWGERVVLVGDLPELGAWDPSAGVPLHADRWPVWSATLSLPRGVRARYKLVTIDASGRARWEPGVDRELTATDGVVSITAR